MHQCQIMCEPKSLKHDVDIVLNGLHNIKLSSSLPFALASALATSTSARSRMGCLEVMETLTRR